MPSKDDLLLSEQNAHMQTKLMVSWLYEIKDAK